MISARGLGRRFGSVWAVEDVSLDIGEGALLALLGPNGAGKTTTVRMLSGLLAPSAGAATVAGYDVKTRPAAVRARIGLVTDVPGLYEQMTPRAYLRFFGHLYSLQEPALASRVDELLELFALDTRADDRIVTFSRGMQQKLALARALLHDPAVLFLDEPTAGLDPLAARAVRELIQGLKNARRGIVLCTHDLDEAERLADQIAVMQAGQILALGTSADLRQLVSTQTQVHITLAPPFPTFAPTGVIDFQTETPLETNPDRIARFVNEGARIVSVTCGGSSLEDVYAAAVDGQLRATKNPKAEDASSTPAVQAASDGDAAALWPIARRAAAESLNDRLTRLMNVFLAIVAPIALVVLAVAPAATPTALPVYLLVIGMLPAVGAVGIAAGQFAGERERGVLTPMLASPASNLAIFGGKVLGSILPPLVYSALAELIYVSTVAVVLGPASLMRLAVGQSLGVVLLVPLVTCLAAVIATLVSSRVRTYNAAQQVAGILVIPVWALFLGLAGPLQSWSVIAWGALLVGLVGVNASLIAVAAATWRREEVLSRT